ncbi:MAG TPA: hypothetical protein VJ833_09535 [Rhodanobacteraceae bacterium]|nr:hypothetical protein [Rhodanobacteraceae bacterium]
MRTEPAHHLARGRAFAWVTTCAVALALAACHHAPPPPSNATPEKAVATNLRLTAMGDFDGLMKNRLPAADYARWREEWDQSHAHPVPASVAQQKQFAKIMQMLTEPGAEAKLAKRLQPELSKLHGDKNAPAPIFAGIIEAAGKQMIEDSPQLGPGQRAIATQALSALIAWMQTTDFSSPKKAQKAIDLACATARQLHVQTLEQWRALDYVQTMRNYGILWNGLENLLNIYGLDVAKSLSDADISTTANEGAHATVKLATHLAGKTISGEWPMLKEAAHWYDAALLTAWRKAHPASAASAAVVPASGATSAPVVPAEPATASSAQR